MIYISGASGFVGKALRAALSGARRPYAALDLRGAAKLPRFQAEDTVVHLAAIAHAHGVSRAELRAVNVELAASVAEAAAAAGARLLFLSSVKVHGEESLAPFRESSPIAPGDRYAQSKALAEEALAKVAGLRLTTLRPPLVYGPGVRANFLALMNALDRRLPLPLAAIANRRSLVYLGNLVDAIVACMQSERAVGRCYLVADGDALSTPELCRRIAAALERPARLFPAPRALLELLPGAKRLTRSLEVDDAALRGDLGWRAPFDVGAALRVTAAWYRAR